ncbi:MAG: hypothetical protein ACOC2Q_03535 [Spirochaetota bacterium]
MIGVALLMQVVLAIHADDSVLQVLVGSPSDSRLEEVLYLATGVELTRAGLTSRRMRENALDSDGEINRRLIRAQTRQNDSRYTLVVDYALGDARIEVEFSLYDGLAQAPLGVRSLSSPIDIDLDSRVSEVVQELIADADLDREPTAGTSLEGVSLQETVASAGVVTPERPRPVVGLEPAAGVDLSVLTSGLFVVGPASEFFSYGVAGTLAGGFTTPLNRIGVGFGARSSVIFALANAGVEGGSLYVVTVAPEARIGTPYRGPARLFTRVSGGAAIVIVSSEDSALAKTDLFAESGVGAHLPLGARFSIGLELNFMIVFEPGLPLMGISPSLTVSMEP